MPWPWWVVRTAIEPSQGGGGPVATGPLHPNRSEQDVTVDVARSRGHERSVVADSCNPIAVTRREWREFADEAGASSVDIEVVCSDPDELCRRVEGRQATVPGLVLPTWTQVLERTYDPWATPRVILDTAGRAEDVVVADPALDTVLIVDVARSDSVAIELPAHSEPFRVVVDDGLAFVTLRAPASTPARTHELEMVRPDGAVLRLRTSDVVDVYELTHAFLSTDR